MFESPVYERSYEGHSVCVRFRYIMYGSGRRVLRLYQQLELMNRTRRLMWAVNESNNTDGTWKYGRVSVPSVTKYRVRKIPTPNVLQSFLLVFFYIVKLISKCNFTNKSRIVLTDLLSELGSNVLYRSIVFLFWLLKMTGE